MIRFADIVPGAKPKTAAAPTPEINRALPPAESDTSDAPKPAKAPRKPKKPA